MKQLSFLLASLLIIASCKQKSSEELLVGSWQFNNIQYEKEISPENKPMIEANIAALRETFSVDYNKDQTYVSHSFREENGKWKIDNERQFLTHIDNEGEQQYKILKLTHDSLFLNTSLQSQTLTLQFVRKK